MEISVARKRLEEMRADLDKTLSVLAGEHHLVRGGGAEAGDAGANLTDADRNAASVQAALAQRAEVLAALSRIDDGSYGRCVDCAGPVPEPPPQGTTSIRAGLARRWGMPALLGLLLVPSLWFVMTIAGPDAWSLQGLRDAPFSPAGETLLAALLLPASLVLAGVWPFGFLANGPRFAPLAALLLVVVLVPMVGEGLEHWRSLYAGWLVLAAFVAAATANWPRVMACAGLFAIACGGATASWSGTSLTIIASLLSLRPATSRPLGRLACLAAGACGMAALQATLAHEVVYSVLMLLAVVLGVLRTPLRPALPA